MTEVGKCVVEVVNGRDGNGEEEIRRRRGIERQRQGTRISGNKIGQGFLFFPLACLFPTLFWGEEGLEQAGLGRVG